MKSSERIPREQKHRLAVAFGILGLALSSAVQTQGFPANGVVFHTTAPFAGTNGVHSLTSNDGLLTVAAWSDTNALTATNLYQWFWILGPQNCGLGHSGLLQGQESMTFQFDKSVGTPLIRFLYTGDPVNTNTPQPMSISGFLSDPGAYASATYTGPSYQYQTNYIVNLSYTNGTLSFGYLYDYGNNYGNLFFANPAASGGQTLRINYNGNTNWGAGPFAVDSQEVYGGPMLQPVSVMNNVLNAYTTPDGALTARAYADLTAQTPTNFGTYLDQCFGVYGGANNGAIDGNETVTLQFAADVGLSRLECVYSSGQVGIYGFTSDPGFSDPGNGSFGAQYSSGLLSFYPADGGHHVFYFTNRAASAGQTLRVNADPSGSPYQFGIAGVGYAGVNRWLGTALLGTDLGANNNSSSYTTPDGLLTLNAYQDTPGTMPTNLYANLDWFGVAGGHNDQAIDGAESLNLQFSGGAGLSGLGTKYTWGTIIISGFSANPGLSDPAGIASGVTYTNGTLSYNFYASHSSESVVEFTHPYASAGRTLSLHTAGSAGEYITLTRINYQVPVILTITDLPGKAVLTWPAGTLQQSANVSGMYTNVSGATSPYTNTASGIQKYFRVKVQ